MKLAFLPRLARCSPYASPPPSAAPARGRRQARLWAVGGGCLAPARPERPERYSPLVICSPSGMSSGISTLTAMATRRRSPRDAAHARAAHHSQSLLLLAAHRPLSLPGSLPDTIHKGAVIAAESGTERLKLEVLPTSAGIQ